MAGDTVNVTVQLQREVDEDTEVDSIGKVIAPRYPNEKVEGWWVVVGDLNSNALLSIKRVGCGVSTKVEIVFCNIFYDNNIFMLL
jgi:pre-mRNA-splicing helicase BRR2